MEYLPGRSRAPQSKHPWASRNPLGWGGWKGVFFSFDLQASGGPRDTPPWASLQLPKSSQWKALNHQASGLHGGVVPWQALLDNQPSSKRPSLGRQPWERDQEGGREGGSRGGRGGGVGAQPGPLGAGPAANSAPTSGPGCPGCGNRGQQARAGRGETTCQRFLQEVPQAQLSCPGSSSADVVSKGEARNPRLPWFATLWALSKRAGLAAAPLPPSPGLCSLVSRCSSSV